MDLRSGFALLTMVVPNLGHATIFTFESDCATPLTVDFGLSTPTGVPVIYDVPSVAWEGVTIQQIAFPDGGTNVALVQSVSTFGAGVSFPLETDVLTSGGTPSMITLDDIGTLTLPGGGTGLGTVINAAGASCLVTNIIATDPIDAAVDAMQQVANDAYPALDPVQVDSGPVRLRPATFRDQLDTARALLTDAGCQVDVTDTVAGAFRPGVDATVGEDASGAPLAGTLDLKARTFSGSLGASALGERFSRYDGTHRFVTDAGAGMYVGYGARVEGRRGVFMGMHATCLPPISAEATLAGWIDGSLAGLDPVDTGELVGVWDAVVDCGFVFPQTWTITDAGASYDLAGAEVVPGATIDTASFVTTGTYDIEGPPADLGAPPGTDTTPRGQVVLDGSDAFGGTVDLASFTCSVHAVRQ